VDVYTLIFFNRVTDGVSGQLHVLADLSIGKQSHVHTLKSWVGPRVGMDVTAKKKVSYPGQESNPDSSVVESVSLVGTLTELFQVERRVEILLCGRRMNRRNIKNFMNYALLFAWFIFRSWRWKQYISICKLLPYDMASHIRRKYSNMVNAFRTRYTINYKS
jgi:hypothetical protein